MVARRWPGILDEPARSQTTDRLLVADHRAIQEGRVDRGQVAAGQIRATSFGRPVRDAGPVDPQEVHGLGFLLGDKKAGPFKMEFEWINVVRAAKE